MPSSAATTRRDSRPFPCSNTVSIQAKKSCFVLKSRLVVAAEKSTVLLYLSLKTADFYCFSMDAASDRQKLQCEIAWHFSQLIYIPDTVQDIAIWEDSDINIGHQNIMETALLFVAKKGVRHPYLFGVCHCEVLNLGWKRKISSFICNSMQKIRICQRIWIWMLKAKQNRYFEGIAWRTRSNLMPFLPSSRDNKHLFENKHGSKTVTPF